MRTWWSNRNDTERFDLYTRGSLYAILGAFVPAAVFFAAPEPPTNTPAAVLSLILFVAATVVGLRVLGRGLDHAIHGGPAPTRSVVVYLALAVATAVAGYVGYGPPSPGDPGAMAGGTLVAVHAVAVVSPLLTWTRLAAIGLGLAAVLAGIAATTGGPHVSVAAVAWTVAFGTAGVIGSFRGSVWMLRIVWELDRSKRIESDLAVAEERLRFARDLHDTMGRNLSVVAVRSELAAELARRGRSEDAAAEMLDVRGMAQESLREMRDVVRAYRSVDLATELAGARSVLRAAGTTTRVIGDPSALPPAVQTTLAWVVREGTTNVLRHADATTCTFRLIDDDVAATLTIENDGRRAHTSRAGTGLAGLRERLAAVGGTLTVSDDNTGADRSFWVTARVPLDAADVGESPPAEAGLGR